MNALFIGRFQPFHKGHLLILQNVNKKYDRIVIGIGSSQYSHTLDNPFSYEERMQMISETLTAEGIHNFQILPIPDIHNPPKWVSHVVSIVVDFDVVITNNSFTQNLFEEKGYTVVGTKQFNRTVFSGTEIRSRMIQNQEWETLVPSCVVSILQTINGVERLKKLAK